VFPTAKSASSSEDRTPRRVFAAKRSFMPHLLSNHVPRLNLDGPPYTLTDPNATDVRETGVAQS
jgi:hypothetical protein